MWTLPQMSVISNDGFIARVGDVFEYIYLFYFRNCFRKRNERVYAFKAGFLLHSIQS